MARESNGPLQIINLDIREINYMLVRIRQELDELRGLRGPITLHNSLTIQEGDLIVNEGDVTVDGGSVVDDGTTLTPGVTSHTGLTNLEWTSSGHTGTAGAIAAFADPSQAATLYGISGNGTTVAMADSPTLTTPTIADFTNAQHDHADADDGGLIADIDASRIGYTPSPTTNENWDGRADPGQVDDALDQLARNEARVDPSGYTHPWEWAFLYDQAGFTGTVTPVNSITVSNGIVTAVS